jgi:hypothetical protein
LAVAVQRIERGGDGHMTNLSRLVMLEGSGAFIANPFEAKVLPMCPE